MAKRNGSRRAGRNREEEEKILTQRSSTRKRHYALSRSRKDAKGERKTPLYDRASVSGLRSSTDMLDSRLYEME